MIDSQIQARTVKYLLPGRDGGSRISARSIQGHERGVVNFTWNQAVLHGHVILSAIIYSQVTRTR